MDFLTQLAGVIISLTVILITYYKWKFQYWKRKNLNQLEPSIPFGNIPNPLVSQISGAEFVKGYYDESRKRGWKHCGLYRFASPFYFVSDLEYAKNILTKDFQYFVDRGVYYNEKDEPLSAHLFAVDGNKWRNLRTKLTPTFTSGKMKMMFPILVECEQSLKKLMDKEVKSGEPIDIKEVLACFTTDIIGSCAFGLDCNTVNSENSPFRVYGKQVVVMTTWMFFKELFGSAFPDFARKLGVKILPDDVNNFFMTMVKNTLKYREENNFSRDDFLQLLLNIRGDLKKEGNDFTTEEIAAQCFVFFIAGYETSSTTMAFAIYELSKHPDIQEKVRKEIKQVLAKHDGKITYEGIKEMNYTLQVIKETLRKYPPVPFLFRKCVKDYKIPDEDVVIEAGTAVFISSMGIHYDPEYYPEPEKFDPDRFTEEAIQSRPHYAHLPFGEGPRNCIGLRFGIMQTKVGLASLLSNYKFTLNEKTPQPLEYDPKSLLLAVKGVVWVNAEKL